MADGYISQITLPNEQTYDFRDRNLKVYTGSCLTAAGTAIKDVVTDGTFTLEKGAVVFVNFSATNSAAVGSLKLKFNGEADTNAKPIKYLVNGNDPANIPGASYLRANQTYMFQYDGTNWVVVLNYYYDSNSFASMVGHYNNILARKAITAESLIVGDSTGYERVASGVTFDLAYPIVWCTTNVAANASNYANMFLQHYDRNIATGAKSGFTSAANKVIYLIVTISGNIATIDSNIITDTLPSSDDGKVYISLGKLGAQSTGANYFFLYPVHPMFWYKNGAIREYSGASQYALAAPLSGISGADDLKAIEAISGTSGLLKKTAANTWTLDTSSYVTSSGITSVTIGATSPVQSSTSTAQSGSSASTTISLADAYGDTKNPYGSKTKNYVLAAPSNVNGAPSFRALVAADIPNLSWNKITSDKPTTLSGYGITDAVSKSAELLTTNPFAPPSLKGPYISKIDNALYAADKRWKVTGTNISSIANLFDGSYESTGIITNGNTSVITFDFDPDHTTISEKNKYFPGYPYGYILISFYYVCKPTSVSGRVYCNYSGHTIGWHNLTFTVMPDSGNSQIVYRAYQGKYQISVIELTIVGDTTNSSGYTGVTQIEMHLDRPDSSRNPFVSKYTAETLYYDLTAPKFIGNLTGTADKATAANLTSTVNAIAYYTDTAGKFGSKASANGALYATSANGALQWGTLPIAQGGTGKTSASEAWTALGGGASGKHADSYFALASHNHAASDINSGTFDAARIPNLSWNKITSDKPAYTTRWPTWDEVTGKPSTFAPSTHNHSQIVTVGDKRGEATTPNSYANQIIFQGLKTNSQIGSPYTDAYSYLIGLRGWSDSSGGNSHELAFNGNGIYRRQGATTTWGNWLHLLDNDNTAAGTNNAATLTWSTTYTIAKINGTDIKFTTMAKPSYSYSDISSRPTSIKLTGAVTGSITLGNGENSIATTVNHNHDDRYKIASGVITLGSSTITPVTSVNGHTGASVSVTASDLGLASALKYVGTKSSLPTATDSTTYSTYNNGDVITVSNKEYAYVKGSNAAGSSWVELGDEGSYKLKQTAFTNSTGTADGSNTSTTFIYSFSQDENGTITNIKTRKLPTYNNYSHPTGDGNLHVPATGTSNNGKVLKAGSTAGSISWGTLSASDVGAAPSSTVSCTTANVKSVLGTGSDATKFLNNKGEWAVPPGTYSLTVSTTSALGGVKVAYQSSQAATVTPATNTTTPTIQARSTSANRSYGVEADKNGVLFVTVPWTNVNSSYLTSSSSLAWSKLTGVPTASTTTAGIITIGTTENDAAAGNHAHGNISNTGTISTSAAIANNDALVIAAATSGTVKKTTIVFDGSTTSQALTKKGTWGTFLTAHGSSYGKIASGAVSTTVTSISTNTATIESKSANEKLTIQAGNKWIQTGATNSSNAGSDVITLGHLVPDNAISNLSTTAQTPSFNSTFNIPTISLDEAGHVTGVGNTTVKIPALPSSVTPSSHKHGNINNDGTLGTTASYGVATDANKKIIAIDLTVNDPAASGNATTFVTSVTQSSQGKISVSRSTVPNASSTTAGIVKLGADGGAATYSHTHSGYLTAHGKSYGGIQVSAQSTTSVALASSSAATTVTAVGANETVKFVTKNKWIVIKGVNSATAGADEVQFAHTAGLTAKTSYCSTSATASANGGKITVTDIQYDEAGHITSTTDRTITLSQTTYSLSSLGAASSTHTHGNISNTGTISTSAAPVNGDAIVISTSANGGLVKKTNITFDGSTTSSYLNKKGDWGTPPDTKNTAGSTATATKIFLIGATAQSTSPQTYSTTFVYATDGVMSAEAFGINHATTANKVTLQWNNTDSSLDFIFA